MKEAKIFLNVSSHLEDIEIKINFESLIRYNHFV